MPRIQYNENINSLKLTVLMSLDILNTSNDPLFTCSSVHYSLVTLCCQVNIHIFLGISKVFQLFLSDGNCMRKEVHLKFATFHIITMSNFTLLEHGSDSIIL